MSVDEFLNVEGNLPDHLKYDDILNGLQINVTDLTQFNQVHCSSKYILSLSLILKSRTGIKSLITRQKIKSDDDKMNVF